jgi:hypothetical protein
MTGEILLSPVQGIGVSCDLPRNLRLEGAYLAGDDGAFDSPDYRVEVTREWTIKIKYLSYLDKAFAGLHYGTKSGVGLVGGLGRDFRLFDDAWIAAAAMVSVGGSQSGLGLSLKLVQQL